MKNKTELRIRITEKDKEILKIKSAKQKKSMQQIAYEELKKRVLKGETDNESN